MATVADRGHEPEPPAAPGGGGSGAADRIASRRASAGQPLHVAQPQERAVVGRRGVPPPRRGTRRWRRRPASCAPRLAVVATDGRGPRPGPARDGARRPGTVKRANASPASRVAAPGPGATAAGGASTASRTRRTTGRERHPPRGARSPTPRADEVGRGPGSTAPRRASRPRPSQCWCSAPRARSAPARTARSGGGAGCGHPLEHGGSEDVPDLLGRVGETRRTRGRTAHPVASTRRAQAHVQGDHPRQGRVRDPRARSSPVRPGARRRSPSPG